MNILVCLERYANLLQDLWQQDVSVMYTCICSDSGFDVTFVQPWQVSVHALYVGFQLGGYQSVMLSCNVNVLVVTIDAQWEGMGDVGSARYEPALLPPCPSIRVLSYSN